MLFYPRAEIQRTATYTEGIVTEKQRLDRWSLSDRITPDYESDMVIARRLVSLAMTELKSLEAPGSYDPDYITYATWELNRELPEVLKSLTWTPYHEQRFGIPCHVGLNALIKQLWGVSRAVTSTDAFHAGMQAIVTLHFTQIECGTPWDAYAMPIFRLGTVLAPSWISIMAGRNPNGLNYRQVCIIEAVGDDILNIMRVREKWDSVWHANRESRMVSLVECFKDVFGIL
jgi:hypothetical protein